MMPMRMLVITRSCCCTGVDPWGPQGAMPPKRSWRDFFTHFGLYDVSQSHQNMLKSVFKQRKNFCFWITPYPESIFSKITKCLISIHLIWPWIITWTWTCSFLKVTPSILDSSFAHNFCSGNMPPKNSWNRPCVDTGLNDDDDDDQNLSTCTTTIMKTTT